ncbi:hypothetical protein KRZ98_18400 [Sphingobium sp. AS12]|uniref:hypothetical protein n=1 Tax=Sphingobium sp. AS12 TaxID=2849495 RepID=UPI001C31B72A|nr:hypothetical protein [Sphingobium sp. AS12]MBV2150210.1 hypothetical protein [Sphingobium sp. AS12]
MELRFMFSGSNICQTEAECVPPAGSEVIIRTDYYKKGLTPGSLIRFTVTDEFPTVYDFSQGGLIAYIDVNGYTVLEAGPDLKD